MSEYKQTLCAWELKFHDEIFNWIVQKTNASGQVDLLDFSCDEALFSGILATRLKINKFVVARRDEAAVIEEKDTNIKPVQINTNDSLKSLAELGPFDVIMLKDMLHEVEDIQVFMETLKANLRNEAAKIFILTRPKNPPLPVPDPAIATWRKIHPTQEVMIAAAKAVGYKEDFYAASCPIRMQRMEWGKVLKSRLMPAIKLTPKCTDKEINEFANQGGKGREIVFEEKYLIFLLRIKTQADVEQEEKEGGNCSGD